MGIDEAVDPQEASVATPDQLADDLEAMGPTYVKLGQVLSGRSDLLPDAYLKALARLQDKVIYWSGDIGKKFSEALCERSRVGV